MNIPVLTYHGMNIGGRDYAHNDHVALDSDLRAIHERGNRIIPLNALVDWLEGELSDDAVAGAVALTTDDGSWFDFYDLDHPSCGLQRSMFNILRDHDDPEWPVHMTSFVIASPQARSSLDRSCMIGKGWWGDEWWREAAGSRIMDVANHSWDHVHPELEQVAQRDQIKGDFSKVDCFDDAEAQIVQAGRYIAGVTGGDVPELFAYPWGDAGDYLVSDYFPRYRSRHGLRAAFTIDPRPVVRNDSPWLLPRYVCGRDWDSPEGLDRILRNAGV